MTKVSGSIKKVILDGVPYVVASDANISETGSQFENSSIATSGANLRKMVKRTELRENIVLVADSEERQALRALADRLDDFPISYVNAEGATFRTEGWIEFETFETEENRATVKLFPRTVWNLFVA